jgi:hypothetical protein
MSLACHDYTRGRGLSMCPNAVDGSNVETKVVTAWRERRNESGLRRLLFFFGGLQLGGVFVGGAADLFVVDVGRQVFALR